MPEIQLQRDYPEIHDNLVELGENAYPGRIAMMGLNAAGDSAIQAYAIMGRSTGSRTRIFTDEGAGSVRTIAPGKTQGEMAATNHAELIYYQASAAGEGVYVVSNGAQTYPVYKGILRGYTLDASIKSVPVVGDVDLSKYEPDAPNYTPRITGVIDLRKNAPTPFGFSIVRKDVTTDAPIHTAYEGSSVRDVAPGVGFGVQTYLGNGDPLPSFDREPYAIPFEEDAVSTARKIWRVLNEENRVALMTRAINLETHKIEETCIINAPPQ